jgi:hypothetical protein
VNFLIADTFTDGLARLTGDEQKAIKTTVFDLQINPAAPGLQFHKLDRAKDKRFWSVRVSRDIRIIVHRTDASLLLCYVDHHDKAYDWAERRKLETHPTTGAAQLVEIRETVHEVLVPVYVEAKVAPKPKPLLFADVATDQLLSYGVPSEWLSDVKQANEDTLLSLAERLPAEAAEALLELATGGKPQVPTPAPANADPFEHPDAQRRFRVMKNVEELERALAFPWDKWTVFLHPAQRQWVERDNSGPARVSGSAGTGKTIVALHRAVFLARKHPDARVLLTTFSAILANALRTMLRRLISNEPRLGERIEVHAINSLGERLYGLHGGAAKVADAEHVGISIAAAAAAVPGHKFSQRFLLGEWEQVVDAWQIETWEGYRDVKRLGRKTRLPETQRRVLWSIFERVRQVLRDRNLTTHAEVFAKLAGVAASAKQPAFDFAVVDECQDLAVAHLKFLAALGGSRPNALFFAGDLGQRIFQQPFSWKAVGIDVRGRSRTLQVNYRTSHQIRRHADQLLAATVSDVDGNEEARDKTVSVFNGPLPSIHRCKSAVEERQVVAQWITERVAEGYAPHELGVFVRSAAQLDRAQAAVEAAQIPFVVLDDRVDAVTGKAAIATMHLAKGLEFRGVAVMACDDEIIPLQERVESISDEADLEDVYSTERHLLYVACTRARDRLFVSGAIPTSEFLDDLSRSHFGGGRGFRHPD